MITISGKIRKHAEEAEAEWRRAYGLFSKVIERKKLKIGVEVGVAFGGHAESILKTSTIDILYGIDPYAHAEDYEDPMNLPQEEFDQLYDFTIERLAVFGDRYHHIRKKSQDAVNDVPEIDFVYIDADHSYKGAWEDICAWFSKVRIGGIIGGHDYNHPNFPGVKRAVDNFFNRFRCEIHIEKEGVWWVEKQKVNITFFIPAYNCANTIKQSVDSIMCTNFSDEDELIVVNDGSTDDTVTVLREIKAQYPHMKLITHQYNRGGGAARNTAVMNASNPILFNLDSDNILKENSIEPLKQLLITSGSHIAAFEKLCFFKKDTSNVTHEWGFSKKRFSFCDYIEDYKIPGASGNYMFTIQSWIRAGGYPEFAGALDAWGFGLRQAAAGFDTVILSGGYYFHRVDAESYWVRESRRGTTAINALQLIIPYLDKINRRDVSYILSNRYRYRWFERLSEKPLRLRSGDSWYDQVLRFVSCCFTFLRSSAGRIKRKFKLFI